MPGCEIVRRGAGSFWIAHVCLALLALASVACESGQAEDKVIEARTAYAQGRLDDAQRLYAEALESEPGNVGALVGLVSIHLDREQLDEAHGLLERLDDIELDRNGAQLADRARERYYQLVYERSRGAGPSAPADAEAYEEALIGLFNLRASQVHADELVQLFVRQARSALGVSDPSRPLAANSAHVQDASLPQLEAARAGYRRFTDRDPRLTRVLPEPDEIQREAEAMVLALDVAIFDRQFDRQFQAEMRRRLIEENRFDSQRNRFRIAFESTDPYEGGALEGEALESFKTDLARTLVIEEMTSLAYEARGMERGDNRALALGGSNLADVEEIYSGVEIVSFEMSRNGMVTMEVLAPYFLLPKTAYRLEQYLEWRARREAEGTGSGTGEGTGDQGLGTGGGMESP